MERVPEVALSATLMVLLLHNMLLLVLVLLVLV